MDYGEVRVVISHQDLGTNSRIPSLHIKDLSAVFGLFRICVCVCVFNKLLRKQSLVVSLPECVCECFNRKRLI